MQTYRIYIVPFFLLLILSLILPALTAEAAAPQDGVTSAALNIRAEPSTESPIIGKYQAGTQIEFIDSGNGWGQVTENRQLGFVSLDYVNPIQSVTSSGTVKEQQYKIVIDPGHGGKDPGASGFNNTEKNVVLQIAQRLLAILKEDGYQVLMTRNEDVFISLDNRAWQSNEWDADVFVSIHANAHTNTDAKGVESYYYPGSTSGQSLASFIQQQLVMSANHTDRGYHGADFYVLRHTHMPAVLVETGFITNASDAALLNSEGYQEKVAVSVAKGITAYLQNS